MTALEPLAHSGSHADGATGAAAWLLPLLIVAVPGALYLAGVVRLRTRSRDWSGVRTVSFGLGLALVGTAVSPPVESVAAGAVGHMVQHVLLGIVAPIPLVLGAPLTLLLSALPVRGRRPVAVLLRSRPLHVLSHVATAAVLTVGALYAVYLTPLYALSTQSQFVHHLLHLHFLLAGYLYAWAVVGPDPAPRRPGMGVRIAVVIATGGAHAVLAKLLYARSGQLPPGSGHRATEMQVAAQWMYYGGHLADLSLLVALFAAWYVRTGRRLAVPTVTVARLSG